MKHSKKSILRESTKEWKEIFGKETAPLAILDVHPRHFVEQLTLYEFEKYGNIQAVELIGREWDTGDKKKNKSVPNLLEYTTHYSRVTNWCINQILSISSVEDRASAISKLIHIMVLAFQCNNFLATFEIFFALYSLPIFRLYETWHKVPEAQLRVLSVLNHYTKRGCEMYKAEFELVCTL